VVAEVRHSKQKIAGIQTETLTEIRAYDGAYALNAYFSGDGFVTGGAQGFDSAQQQVVTAFIQRVWDEATGKLKAWDNHATAGAEALCSAHFIMHEQEEETTQPDHHRDVSKCH